MKQYTINEFMDMNDSEIEDIIEKRTKELNNEMNKLLFRDCVDKL